jgi:amidase
VTAREIAEQVRSGARSATDVVREALDAVARLDPVLHFIDELDPDRALAAAAEADRSSRSDRSTRSDGPDRALAGVEADRSNRSDHAARPDRPLAGVPFLVKARTPANSPIVARLTAAGAIPIGTSTRAHARALSQTFGWNGTDYTRNPWSLDHSPGGSSAGAAASVAAGVVPIATGGDTAGSLRIPAAYCGVIGLKGTYGRVPRPAGRALGQLTVSGIIGAYLDDVVLATSIASGPDRLDPGALPHWPVPSPAAGPWRVAYRAQLCGAAATTEVDAAVRGRVAALDSLTVVDVPLDLVDVTDAWVPLNDLDTGRPVTAEALARALEIRRHNETALADLFTRVDALITPTTPTTAHGYDQHEPNLWAGDLCWLVNLTGHPAASVPIGLIDGLPVGLQVIAPLGRDDIVVAIAARAQVALPRPPHAASDGTAVAFRP